MENNFLNKIKDGINIFVENGHIDEDRIQILKRPPYFNQYKFSVGFSPDVNTWHKFDELKQNLSKLLGDICHLQSNFSTLSFYAYSNDPNLLKIIFALKDEYVIGFINIIDPDYWDKNIPRKIKRKTKFYHQFNYRIRFSRSIKHDNINEHINRLNGLYFWGQISKEGQNLLYIEKLSDLTILKVIFHENIIDIDDRSNFNK